MPPEDLLFRLFPLYRRLYLLQCLQSSFFNGYAVNGSNKPNIFRFVSTYFVHFVHLFVAFSFRFPYFTDTPFNLLTHATCVDRVDGVDRMDRITRITVFSAMEIKKKKENKIQNEFKEST